MLYNKRVSTLVIMLHTLFLGHVSPYLSKRIVTSEDTVCFMLTGEFCPAGRSATDGMNAETSESIIKQLPISDPEAQQDPVNLLLRRGLRTTGQAERMSPHIINSVIKGEVWNFCATSVLLISQNCN